MDGCWSLTGLGAYDANLGALEVAYGGLATCADGCVGGNITEGRQKATVSYVL
jgi:hypothetical protein